MKTKKLFLDDVRTPRTEDWEIVRSYEDFVNYINENGLPDEISFDHDLASIEYDSNKIIESFVHHEKTGYDAAKWLCDYCWSNGLPLPKCNVHSANPVGRDNILSILRSFEKKLNY